MVDKKFFQEYESLQKDRGIPGVRMNEPLAVNALGNIGLELEIEGVGLPRDGHLEKIVGGKTGARWTAVTDGSLRGEAREYILTVPCDEEELPAMLGGLYTSFKSLGSNLTLSNRCSTHVHINMKGKTVNLVTSAIALWVMFEDSIVSWCGEERTSNHFCLTAKEAGASLLPAWESYLRIGGGNFDERGNLKYCSLNIFPLFSKGSIEMRCGPRPESEKKVADFAKFCYKLVKYSERYTNPTLIANDISERGALQMFKEICGDMDEFMDKVVTLAGGVEAFNQKCMDGFRRTQGIVMGHPWDRWLTLINKEFVPDPFRKTAGRGQRLPPRRPVTQEDVPAEIDNPALEEVIRANRDRDRVPEEIDIEGFEREAAFDRELQRARAMLPHGEAAPRAGRATPTPLRFNRI